MPLLQKNQNNLTKTNSSRSPLLNVRREDIFYREDIKMTFVYALIGISAVGIIAAFGYMGVQQLRK